MTAPHVCSGFVPSSSTTPASCTATAAPARPPGAVSSRREGSVRTTTGHSQAERERTVSTIRMCTAEGVLAERQWIRLRAERPPPVASMTSAERELTEG